MTASKSISDPRSAGPRRARIAGLVAGLLVMLALQLSGSDTLGRQVFDAWQRLSPRTISDTPVRIVWIDDASIADHGAWPWSRDKLSRLVDAIGQGGASVIGLDMLFPEEDRSNPDKFAALYPEMPPGVADQVKRLTSMDELFAEVIGHSPVVLGRAGVDRDADPEAGTLAVEAQFSGAVPPGVQAWPHALANIHAIDDVALGHGILNGNPDADGMVRRVPLVARVAGTPTPGFALELARIASGEEAIGLEAGSIGLEAVRLGNRRLAVDRDGTMRVALGTLPATANLFADDILDGRVAPAALADKIVIVGLQGAGTADLVSTPLAANIYGASVQAAAVDAILAGDSLSRPSWSVLAELALALVLVGIATFALPRLRPARAALVLLAVASLVVLASFVAFRSGGLLLDPARPLLTAVAAGIVTLVLLFAESRRQQSRLHAALQEQRIAAALADGELSAARDIQIGMLPPRASLSGFDANIDLDALIEPAKSIGGDFYDVIRLDRDHICFLIGDVTGKGVAAALFMALSKALAKSILLRRDGGLAAAISRLNDEIARDNVEDMFVTMMVGLIDTRTGQFEFCNAGHEDPLLVRASGAVEPLRSEGGPPLAVVPGYAYPSATARLAIGDSVVIVSDGITEAQNADGGFFGSERLRDVLANWANQGEIDAASNALLAEVRLFEDGADATDDLTVLVFRYNGPVAESG